MKKFIIRKPAIDLKSPFARHWCGNDAFNTAFFNALSVSFPTGEQFFIDSVKKATGLLSGSEKDKLNEFIHGFVGQETFHRKYHELFNAQLASHGVIDCWALPVQAWQRSIEHEDARIWMAVTAALEHFTAILSQWLLLNPNILEGTEDRIKHLWLWHASEEIEHREMALHVFRKINGTEEKRIQTYKEVTRKILLLFVIQVVVNLWSDGSLFKVSTWKSAYEFFFGRTGFLKNIYKPWKSYLCKDFSPQDMDSQIGENWLEKYFAA